MNVSLTPELERLVTEKVATGLYNSASEVVREALRLLRERDEIQAARRERLNREIADGIEDIRQGRTVPGEEAFSRLRARSQKKRAK